MRELPNSANLPFPVGSQIKEAELLILEKEVGSLRGVGDVFWGHRVAFRKKLSPADLAPLRKIFSIRDIFRGPITNTGLAEIGLRVSFEHEGEFEILVSTSSCSLTVVSDRGRETLPLDRHVTYLVREAVGIIHPKKAEARILDTPRIHGVLKRIRKMTGWERLARRSGFNPPSVPPAAAHC